MSGYKSFAIAGLGNIGVFLAEEFLKAKQAGTVSELVLLTRAVRRFLAPARPAS